MTTATVKIRSLNDLEVDLSFDAEGNREVVPVDPAAFKANMDELMRLSREEFNAKMEQIDDEMNSVFEELGDTKGTADRKAKLQTADTNSKIDEINRQRLADLNAMIAEDRSACNADWLERQSRRNEY